jgi:hypothetical protein
MVVVTWFFRLQRGLSGGDLVFVCEAAEDLILSVKPDSTR